MKVIEALCRAPMRTEALYRASVLIDVMLVDDRGENGPCLRAPRHYPDTATVDQLLLFSSHAAPCGERRIFETNQRLTLTTSLPVLSASVAPPGGCDVWPKRGALSRRGGSQDEVSVAGARGPRPGDARFERSGA